MQEPEIRFASRPTTAFNELKIKSGFSLNEVKNNSRENGSGSDEPVVESKEDKVVLTAELVKNTLFAFAEQKQNNGARQLYVTITKAGFEFNNDVLVLVLNNETQREQLQNLKQELLDDIRSRLGTNRINLEIKLAEHQVQTKAYKPADIFKAMAEKNPSLLELKKRFDLEIDY